MKTKLNHFSGKVAFLGLLLAAANVASAQTYTTTTTAGTMRDFTPSSFSVTTAASPLPVHYTYTKTTTYVDENGNPVSVETVRSGAPVTVYYERNGDQMIAQKVVMRKSVDTTNADGSTSTRESTTTMDANGQTIQHTKTTTTTTETVPNP